MFSIFRFIVFILSVKFGSFSVLQFDSEKFHNTNSFWRHRGKILEAEDDKQYLFSHDGKRPPYAFENKYGKLVGFDVDLVSAVCEIAGKSCHVILTEPTECSFTYKTIEYSGVGMESNWFSGCPSYAITPDRQNQFDFTVPYLTTSSSFAVGPGNPSNFDPSSDDYSHFTFVYVTGAYTNQMCFTRIGKKYNLNTFLVAQNLQEAKEAVMNKTADVLFSPHHRLEGLDILNKTIQCSKDGAGVMVKKGSSLPQWWNKAFRRLFISGKFHKLCSQASREYQADIPCIKHLNPSKFENSDTELSKSQVTKRLWKFVVSGHIYPFSFLDENGTLIGFTKDMISKVCKIANKSCVLLLAKVSECSHRTGELLYPGRGLLENWFDACTGYFNSQDRRNSWDFTSPYLVSNASFYAMPGNPSGFSPKSDNYTDYKIVHLATSITNDHCLNRLRKQFDPRKLLVVETAHEAQQYLKAGKADVWFTKLHNSTSLDRLPGRFHCENVGTSVMVKKGSELPSWWNPAFKHFYNSGQFNEFCELQEKQYNYSFPCLQPPTFTES